MISYDRSYLPPAIFEFVVIADTHHIVDPGMYRSKGDSVTPELTRDWSGRGDVALAYAKALDTRVTFHVGDLQQEYPGHEAFAAGRAAAIGQLRDAGFPIRMVAGNMDIGDKMDPTMPAGWVDREFLDAWHEDFGPSFYSLDEGPFHFVVLNSQVLNSSLEEGAAQHEWLEVDLRENEGRRIVLFLHIPPFLVEDWEPGLGSYDVLDEPARSWLLDLMRRYHVQALFSGHTHFQTFNRVGSSRIHSLPSTTTTRPGFYESLSVAPPVRGWADTEKLGFFLVRAMGEGLAVHLIRTNGRSELPPPSGEIVLTCVTREMPASPLGAYLRLPLARHSDGAIAYPYQVRHRIRDDYPLLACLELGLGHVRFPMGDLESPIQRDRLALLRDEGVALTGSVIWARGREIRDPAESQPQIDLMEVQLAGATLPDDEQFAALDKARDAGAVALCPIVMESAGTVHKRGRNGYRPAELPTLDRELVERGLGVDCAICFVDISAQTTWQAVLEFPGVGLDAIGGLDFILPLGTEGETDVAAIVEGVMAAATIPGSRVLIDPLQELDRTAAVMDGLLDRLSNPTPMFHVIRVLNTLLFHTHDASFERRPLQLSLQDGATVQGVVSGDIELWLVRPGRMLDMAGALADRHGPDASVKLVDPVRAVSRAGIAVGELPHGLGAWTDGLTMIEVAGPVL